MRSLLQSLAYWHSQALPRGLTVLTAIAPAEQE